MKTKSLIIVAASLALLVTNSALADERDGRRGGDNNNRHHSENYRSNDRSYDRSYDRYDNRGHDNRGYDHRGYDNRRGNYNGNNRYYAPRQNYNYYNSAPRYYNAPQPYYNSYNYAPNYRRWNRGDNLGYYHSRYQPVYYGHYHLRPPPRGYHWVRDDRGDFILAAIATGIILEVILGGY